MKTASQEALQIALRDCSKETRKVSRYVIFHEGGILVLTHIFFQKVSAGLLMLASHEEQPSP